MAKQSLLEIVKDILSDMDSDEVNSIDDTIESTQVAAIVASTLRAMYANRNWPHTRRLVNLTPSGDSSKPTIMSIADNVKEVISVYYNKAKITDTGLKFMPVKWIEPDDMLRVMYNRNTADSHVVTFDGGGGQMFIVTNNAAPTYYTSFDDTTIVFDSYDAAVDTTLTANKTQMRAYTTPVISITDSYIPDLPEEAFPLLIEEAKSKCQFKLKQFNDVKSEQESKRQNQWISRKSWRVNGGIKYPSYGRNKASPSDPTFKQE
jgi:hypothetical protein